MTPRGHRHRARFDIDTIEAIAQERGTVCRRCRLPIDLSLPRRAPMGATVNHIIAWADGGSDSLDNLELMHSSCNKAVGRRSVPDTGPTSRAW